MEIGWSQGRQPNIDFFLVLLVCGEADALNGSRYQDVGDRGGAQAIWCAAPSLGADISFRSGG